MAIKKLRKAKGLTQAALAEKLMVQPQAVSKWELGINTPDVYTIERMCAEFGVTVDEFLSLADGEELAPQSSTCEEQAPAPKKPNPFKPWRWGFNTLICALLGVFLFFSGWLAVDLSVKAYRELAEEPLIKNGILGVLLPESPKEPEEPEEVLWNTVTVVDYRGNRGQMQLVASVPFRLKTPLREGYVFMGWREEGTNEYFDFETVRYFGEVTVYETWREVEYSLSFVNETTGETQAHDLAYFEKCAYIGEPLTRVGYTLEGWLVNNRNYPFDYQFSGEEIGVSDGERVIAKANWKPITFIVRYENGFGYFIEKEVKYDQEWHINTSVFERTGYWLAHFVKDGEVFGEGYSLKNATAVQGEKLVFVAQWTAEWYWLYYRVDGNEWRSTQVNSDTEITLPEPTKEGYKFLHWKQLYGEEEKTYLAGEKASNFMRYGYLEGMNKSVHLEAVFEQLSYTFTFDGNGADGGEMPLQRVTTREKTTLVKNAFWKEGYLFVGWTSDSPIYYEGEKAFGCLDGVYKDECTVYGASLTEKTFTLKARWVKALWGAGTESSPYLVQTAEDLQAVAFLVHNSPVFASAHYRLTADIDMKGRALSPIGYDYESGWFETGFGRQEIPFTGSFDGNGKVIKNASFTPLVVGRYSIAGLFGLVKEGQIYDLGVTYTAKISAGVKFATLAVKYLSSKPLQRCFTSGEISATYQDLEKGELSAFVGAHCPQNGSGGIFDCYATGKISYEYSATQNTHYSVDIRLAGLVATANGSLIERCYTDVDIENTVKSEYIEHRLYVGGLVADGEQATVKNCFVLGEISLTVGSSYYGRVIGFNYVCGVENLFAASEGGYAVTTLSTAIQEAVVETMKPFEELCSSAFLQTLGFSETVWLFGEGGAPTLKKFGGGV